MTEHAVESTRKKTGFASDVLKLVSGTMIAQALSVLASPILTRLYGPDAFGLLAVFTSFTSILAVIICLRYELAIMLPESDEEAANLLALSLGIATIISLLTIPLLWLGGPLFAHWLNAPGLSRYLWLMPPVLLFGGIGMGHPALNYWAARTRHFRELSVTRVIGTITTIGVQLPLGFAGFASAGGLIGGSIVGSIISPLVLGWQIWRDDRKVFQKHIRLYRMLDGLIRYRKFPLVDSWGGFLNALSWQLPSLMLSAFFSQAMVGYYALAYRLIQLPMALIGSAIAQVFFQRVSELHSKQEDLASTVEMVFRRLVALGLFPALLVTVIGRDLFIVVFGQNWAEAGLYVQILGLWAFFWFISSPLSTLFAVLEHQELGLIVQVAILVTRILSLVVGGVLHNVYLALGLFAGSGVFVYGGLSIWNLTLAGVPLRSSFHTLLQYGLYSAPMIVILLLSKAWFMAPGWLVLVIGTVGLLIYYLLIMYQDPRLYRYFVSFLSRSGD